MSDLPAGWTACTLGDIVERIETGKSVKCDERPPQGTEDGLVKISAVTWGEFNEQESKTLFDSSHLKPEEKIQVGDFLISRANTLELVGSCVMVKRISKNLYLSDKVLRLVLSDEAKPWLLVCLRSQSGRQQIESLATGNQLSMRNISQQALKDIRIPLPPLAEQTRIAAKLDELLAQVDTLKARIDGIPALLKRFRQSVLTAAVSGRLTEEWRLKTASFEASSEMQLGDESLVVPASWKKTRLGDVTKKDKRLCYGVIQPGPEVDKGVDLIRVCDIKDGTIDWGRLRKIDNGIDAEYSRSRVREGDIVVSIVGTIGRAAIVRESRNANIARAVALISVDQELVLPSWAYIWLTAPVSQWWLTSSSKEVARKTLNLKELIEMPVPRPSIAEQTEIVRRVEQLFAFADQLEARVKATQARIDLLTQSILAKAFRGELVPQDPNDEPASVLLERIKAQRAAAPKAKRGRKASA